MEKIIQHTYQQSIKELRLFELTKESGIIYSKSLKEFLGCGHFKKTNDFLIKNDLGPIDWIES